MRIGIVGVGNMGAGIAQKYASEGFQTTVFDLTPAALDRGRARIEDTLRQAVERRIFKPERAKLVLDNLAFTADFQELRDCDLIVEAIYESLDAKQSLFAQLDAICGPHTILATNTSSFYVRDLANSTQRTDRFIGLHYFYHPAKNRLVEVIRGPNTSELTFEKVWRLQEQIGKIPIESKDSPGFIVNRFFVPWLNESMRIVEEGVANIATVESAAKKAFSIGMGPFELMNVTGLPITLHAATNLAKELGDFYAPCPLITGKDCWELGGNIDETKLDTVSSRLEQTVFSIAKQMVLTERVCSVEDCDLGARVGLRWKKGPFEMMGESPQFVSSSISENIGKITLNRPDSLNALNETMIVELRRHFDTLAHNESVQGIVIEGRGKAFVAGADTHFFVEQIEQNKVARIVEFATSAQALFHDIDQCAKPVVCCIDGLALGGGFELALACDYIVASPRAAVGFPETGIGIYPGLGGTQRTPRRIGIPLSRWMILSGEIVDSNTAHQVGLFDDVIERDQLTKRAIELARQPLPKAIRNANWELPDAFKMIAETYRSPLSSLAETQKRLAGKAPLALAHADELIRATQSRSLNDGLAAELGGLARIFATKDALTGLSSIGKHKPIFEGV